MFGKQNNEEILEPVVTDEGELVESAAINASLPTSEAATAADETVGDEEMAADEEPQDVIQRLEQELASAQAKADGAMDRLQRTVAEYQNSRKRQEKQVAEQIERASAHLIQRLLPILDDFGLAFRNVPPELLAGQSEAGDLTSQVAWVDGFSQIHRKLQSLLEEQDVTMIALDGEFDPERHEAISSEPNDEVESGHIIETLRLGYEHKGRVLRPALVRIAM